MDKKKVLITSKHFQQALNDYTTEFKKRKIDFDIIKSKQFVEKKEIINIIHKYDGVICSDDIFDKEVLLNAKKLKVISKWGKGINTIDTNFAIKRGIIIKNCINSLDESTSNYVVGLILSITRNITQSDQEIKNGNWKRFVGSSLEGKTLGVIGCGNIGKEIFKKMFAFNMNFITNDIVKINQKFLKKYKIKQKTKNYLIKNSDIISINTDLNRTSLNLITKKQFAIMNKNVILINCARGKIVNEKDMFDALKQNKIKAVGVDVFDNEPYKNKSMLKKFKSSVFSSHNAFNTKEAVEKTHFQAFNNLINNLK